MQMRLLFRRVQWSSMTAFPSLSDQNIDDILYYTTVGELKKPVDTAVAELTGFF